MTSLNAPVDESSIPTVVSIKKRAPILLFAVGLAALAIVLFVSLESARMARKIETNEFPSDATDLTIRSESPDLYIPPSGDAATQPVSGDLPFTQPLHLPIQYRPSPFTPMPSAARPAQPSVPHQAAASPYSVSSPSVLPPALTPSREDPEARPKGTAPERIMASRIRNVSATVVQGTMIRAVLETAVDSTRPGQARALVTRDVKGFDGTQVLIPRGSRLFGAYSSDATGGQNRLMIRWSRLILPGGVSVALDSPVADPLGRAGVRAHVDNHLLTRLGDALIGASGTVAGRLMGRTLGTGNQVVVALPGAIQAGASTTPQSQITRTLKIPQGERISVFVAHDLDFSDTSP